MQTPSLQLAYRYVHMFINSYRKFINSPISIVQLFFTDHLNQQYWQFFTDLNQCLHIVNIVFQLHINVFEPRYVAVYLGALSVFIIRLMRMHGSQWRSLAAACSLYKAVFLLEVTQESESGTISHICTSEHAMNRRFMYKTIIPIVPTQLYQKKYHTFAVGIATRAVHS